MTSFIKKYSDTEKLGADEKNKQWQREFLMDRLRSHHPQHKLNYPELSKAIRMAMLEKRYALDAVEKSNLQKCLDSMQHCIKVTTRQGLVERLESLSRQLGLKFMEDSSGLFISSDMFFLEIILDSSGMLTDVKVHHECKIEQQSCSELVTCLHKGDFADFTNQLEGLSSIYQLNAEPKVKSKAFVALQAVETDLYNLYKWKSLNKDMPTLLRESPVGVVQKRRGGHPMKMTYFISSYDLLSLKNKAMLPLTMELLKTKDIGMNVSVHLEASSANKLQILPSVTFSKDNNFPIYSPLTQNNSTLLPATFVLRLNEPLPVCNSLLGAIGHTGEFSTTSESILQLTIQVASKGLVKKSAKELFVSLPDQNHCYFFTENKNMHGSIVTSVPFTEPSQVPKMLTALKQQALFYTFLASCVRTDGKLCNLVNTTMLEVNAISLHKISVALQHSNEDSLVSVEFEFKDISNISVKLFSVGSASNYDVINQKLTKVAEATISIPLTIRYLLKLWEKEALQSILNHCNTENGKYDITGPSTDSNVNNNRNGNRCVNFRDNKTKYERNNGNSNDNNSYNNLFSRPTFFNTGSVPITSSDLLSETNLLNSSSSSNLMVNQFGIKTEQIKDFTSSSLQQEDFCKSPKSKIPDNSINNLEISLGKKNNLQTANILNSNITKSSLLSNHLTIEKYSSNSTKNIDLNKNIELREKNGIEHKNTISITPVVTNAVDNNVSKDGIQPNGHNKRLEIEIIPILTNPIIPSVPIMSLNNCNTIKNQIAVKKRCDERESSQQKADKKRRRKDHFSSARDKIGLKIIELKDSTQTVENMTMNSPKKQQCNSSSNRKLVNKNLFHMSKHPRSLSLASGSGGKPNLTTLKSATNSSNISQKRKTDLEDNCADISGASSKSSFSLTIDNQLGKNKFNETQLTNGISVNNKDNTINILKLQKHGELNSVLNKLKETRNSINVLDNNDKNTNLPQNYSSKTTKLNEGCTNSKYMIKPTVNRMKLTINKTRIAETIKRETYLNNQLQRASSSSSIICDTNSHSPNKKHTGLKPGVSSGPASKLKTTVLSNSNTGVVLTKNDNKIGFYKSHSSECLPLNKDAGNSSSTGMGKGLSKSLSSNCLNTSSPIENIFGKDKDFAKGKLNSTKTPEKCNNFRINSVGGATTKKNHQQISPKVKNAMEGLIKTLNTNFQIPKLSTKSSNSQLLAQKNKDIISNSNNIPIPAKSILNLSAVNKIQIQKNDDTNPSVLIAGIPQINNNFTSNMYKNNVTSEKEYFNKNGCKILNNLSKLQYSKILDNSADDINMTKLKTESNYVSKINKNDYNDCNKIPDSILANSCLQKNHYPAPPPPLPPALSMHIIKTPVSSPAPLQTSLLSSTCIDNDLMDEALVGIGSK